MKNPKLFDAALTAVWAIEPTALDIMLEIADRKDDKLDKEALEAYRAKYLERAERARIRDGVAIIDMAGPMFKRGNLMVELCGATSYEILMRDFRTALDNANVNSILLNVDSPGGEAAGCGEFASAVFEARGGKPIVAYVGDQACSAAYWIASAAGRIVIGEGAEVGCLGVRCAITDSSARDAARGLRSIEFVSSQTPFKALDIDTKDGRARIQARVDAAAQVFIESVAKHRDVSVGHVLVRFGRGDVLTGRAAVEAGMADSIGTFESVIATMSREDDPFSKIGITTARSGQPTLTEDVMSKTKETAAVESEAETTATAPAFAPASEPAAPVVAQTSAADEQAIITAERKRVADLYALTLPGYEKERDEAIQTGSSASDFSAKVIAMEKAKAAVRADAVTADTKVNGEVSPSKAQDTLSGDDAAVKAILDARKLALGE